MIAALIAETVRDVRRSEGLTQAELARRIGTTQSAVSRLESGRLVPTLALLERVAAATGRHLAMTFDPGSPAPPPMTPARPAPRASAGRPLPSAARRPRR